MTTSQPTRPSPHVTVRRLQRQELAPLARAIPDELSEAQVNNRWREQEMGYRELLAAEVDGELVGTVSLSETEMMPSSLHLFALEVAPGARGRGIGEAIVRFVLAEARRRGRMRVYLEVRADNPARRLYFRLGFRRVGRAFVNSWWRYRDDGSQERVEELSHRMVRRVLPSD